MVSIRQLEVIVHAFITSRLDYCNAPFLCFNKTVTSMGEHAHCTTRVTAVTLSQLVNLV